MNTAVATVDQAATGFSFRSDRDQSSTELWVHITHLASQLGQILVKFGEATRRPPRRGALDSADSAHIAIKAVNSRQNWPGLLSVGW